ncbi:DUF685 domain-containing protein, partial [Borrelia crocidurae]
MSNTEDTVVKHDDTVHVKDLDKVSTVEDHELLVLDDGISSCHAISYANFFKTTKEKLLKDENPPHLPEIIKKNNVKQTIVNELLNDDNFINQAYQKVIEKLKNNESSVMDSILSKVTNKLEYDLSQQDTLNTNTYFLGLYYSSLKKIKVQEYLTG